MTTNGNRPEDWREPVLALPISENAKRAGIHAISQAMLYDLAADPDAKPKPVFQRFSVFELMNQPKKEWLVKDLIGARDLVMIFGEAGSGKTFVTIDLLLSAALGETFAGKFQPARPLAVAYCAGEGQGGLPNRFAAATNRRQLFGTDRAALLSQNLGTFTDVPQLFTADVPETIYQFVDDWQASSAGPLDLLVIDTLHSSILGADENNAKDAGKITQAAKHAIASLGCTVALIHHANRAGKYRGSSAFHGAMDAMLETKFDDKSKIGTLEAFKLKDAEKWETLYYRLVVDPVAESPSVQWLDRETIQLNEDKPSALDRAKNTILELLSSGEALNQTTIVENVKLGRHTVLRALKELEEAGLLSCQIGEKNSKIYQLRMDI